MSAKKLCVAISLSFIWIGTLPLGAWSNRGHRAVNLIAIESIPTEMPDFMRTPEAIREIVYLGPEPDRWRPEGGPELSSAASPDHFFRLEFAQALGNLPRKRYDFIHDLERERSIHPESGGTLTAQYIGTLPWQVEEVFERLREAFVTYRVAIGEFPEQASADIAPISKADIPDIEASAIFYAGWMGHYVGDASMPLHTTVNLAGWAEKDNPHHYTTKSDIHHRLEVVVDSAFEKRQLDPKLIEKQVKPPRHLTDPFMDTLTYLQTENAHEEEVYQIDQRGGIMGSGSPELHRFVEARMAEGGGMLRDLIYTAWIDSAAMSAAKHDPRVILSPVSHQNINSHAK